mgnify:CR=1 FL=1
MKKYQDRQSRREQIARAALTILGEEGLQALTMRLLARKIGLVPSAVYRHFQNKDEVLEAAFELVSARLAVLLRQASKSSKDAEEKLHFLLQNHLQIVVEQPGVARLVFGSFAFSDDPLRRSKVRAIIDGYVSSVSAMIKQGQKRGNFRKDVSAKAMAIMFLGLIQSPIILHHVTDGSFSLIRQAQKVWSPFISGLRRQENGHK